ncbi:MAG TPA: hypothetical protein VF654_05570 [Pyrinomonadaceae bacterium]
MYATVKKFIPRGLAFAALASLMVILNSVSARAQWTTSGTTTSTTNNVGVGTSTPAQMFHVHSIGTWAGTRVTTAATGSTINDGVHFGYDDSYGAIIWNREATNISFATSNAERMRLDASGNLGLGTTTPAARFHLVGGNGALNNPAANAPVALQVVGGTGGNGTWGASPGGVGGPILLAGGTGGTPVAGSNSAKGGVGGAVSLTGGGGGPDVFGIGGGAGGNVVLNGGPGVNNSHGSVLLANERGNVGVGTNTPTYKLDVAGQVRSSAGGFVFPDGTVQTTAAAGGGGTTASNLAATNVSAGPFGANVGGGNFSFPANVGFGTVSPGHRLHVVGAGQEGVIVDATTYPEVRFDRGGVPKGYLGVAGAPGGYGVGTLADSVTLRSESALHLISNAGTVGLTVSGGKVGIGTTAPASRLHVAGDITVDGNINAKYQDVAEWVPTTQKLQAGTVVILDTQHNNHVTASMTAYDTRVAGVVSAQPGLTLGVAGEGKALVATTGRVKVRVDATRAPIRIGDLIVTSDVQGVGMKSEPASFGGISMHRPGTIIGKALEPLAGGAGEILVLLSLQ